MEYTMPRKILVRKRAEIPPSIQKAWVPRPEKANLSVQKSPETSQKSHLLLSRTGKPQSFPVFEDFEVGLDDPLVQANQITAE